MIISLESSSAMVASGMAKSRIKAMNVLLLLSISQLCFFFSNGLWQLLSRRSASCPPVARKHPKSSTIAYHPRERDSFFSSRDMLPFKGDSKWPEFAVAYLCAKCYVQRWSTKVGQHGCQGHSLGRSLKVTPGPQGVAWNSYQRKSWEQGKPALQK